MIPPNFPPAPPQGSPRTRCFALPEPSRARFGEQAPPFGRDLSPGVVMDTKTTTTLFASDDGRFGCLPHAPFPGSDTWFMERWHALTKREADEFAREVGRLPACETCAAIARNGVAR